MTLSQEACHRMMDHNIEHRCGWCSQPVATSVVQTAQGKGEGVVEISELTTACYAYRQSDGTVWHPECFVKHLAHTDEIKGITR